MRWCVAIGGWSGWRRRQWRVADTPRSPRHWICVKYSKPIPARVHPISPRFTAWQGDDQSHFDLTPQCGSSLPAPIHPLGRGDELREACQRRDRHIRRLWHRLQCSHQSQWPCFPPRPHLLLQITWIWLCSLSGAHTLWFAYGPSQYGLLDFLALILRDLDRCHKRRCVHGEVW